MPENAGCGSPVERGDGYPVVKGVGNGSVAGQNVDRVPRSGKRIRHGIGVRSDPAMVNPGLRSILRVDKGNIHIIPSYARQAGVVVDRHTS